MLCCTPSESFQYLLCFLATTGSVSEVCVSEDWSSVTAAVLVAHGHSVCSCTAVIWEVTSVDVPRKKAFSVCIISKKSCMVKSQVELTQKPYK